MLKKGFTLIELMIVIAIIAIIAAIAIPNLIEARKHGNEAAAIGALKTINTAQSLFREGDKDNDTLFNYGNLAQLSDQTLIDGVLGSGTKQGYGFAVAAPTGTSEFLWYGVANPVVPQTTGDRYFVTNQAGVVFYTQVASYSLDVNAFIPTDGSALPVGK